MRQYWSRLFRAKALGGSGVTATARSGITGWNSGDLFCYDSKTKSWAHWHLPGDSPQPYAVYVDETDAVWVSDWSANAILRFDPRTEKFETFPLPDRYASVRQLAGRKGEVWGAESGADKLFVLKTE
jgi:virginiamycin B lyase